MNSQSDLDTLYAELDSFLLLKADWAPPIAASISPSVVSHAKVLIRRVAEESGELWKRPEITPLISGGVGIRWRAGTFRTTVNLHALQQPTTITRQLPRLPTVACSEDDDEIVQTVLWVLRQGHS